MKFWNFMFGAGLLAAASAFGLVVLGASARVGWVCLKAGWALAGWVFP